MKIKIDNEKLWEMIVELINAEVNCSYAEDRLTGVRVQNAARHCDETRRAVRSKLLLPPED